MDTEAEQVDFAPEPGTAIEILPGIQWARVDLGAYYLRHTNVYGMRGERGWTLVDTGLPGESGRAQWQQLLAGPFSGPVERIIATHSHPDHIGQVDYLQQATGAPLWMTAKEWAAGRAAGAPGGRAGYLQWLQRAGLSAEQLGGLGRAQQSSGITSMGTLPDDYRELLAGEELSLGPHSWRVAIDAGHSPAPASFSSADAAAVIVGDQLMPHMYPFIGLGLGEDEGDPLAGYLDYLAGMQRTEAHVTALPGHGGPYRNVAGRAAKITSHHTRRLERLVELLAEPKTLVEALPAMFNRPMEGFFLTIGITEAASHLRYLVNRGAVDSWTDAEGRDLYRRR